ncbi:MAG: prepilin-type N-terminal cleavage/methylation domain-containing protein [Gammaproteobacteria bacterium]|nr:prepilin-type N-terminal cleavage/methylation domain-containing protein [Gammaproteobacteria bacterium]
MRPRRRGFTLLEVLVAVAIFALLFAVLMGGWYQAMQAQARLADAAQQIRLQQQVVLALRRLLAEALNPPPGAGTAFTGTRSGFTAETTSSLAPELGAAPLATTVRFDGAAPELRLAVAHPGRSALAYPARLLAAQLRYVDDEGRAHDQWPDAPGTLQGTPGRDPALPALVELTLQFEGQARASTLLVAPRATSWHIVEPSQPFGLPTN